MSDNREIVVNKKIAVIGATLMGTAMLCSAPALFVAPSLKIDPWRELERCNGGSRVVR
jgi:hypothetical protein